MSRPGPWCACVTWRSTKARSRSTCDARWPARSASPARPDFWVRRGEDRSGRRLLCDVVSSCASWLLSRTVLSLGIALGYAYGEIAMRRTGEPGDLVLEN